MSNNIIDSLYISLELDTSNFNKSFKKVTKDINGVFRTINKFSNTFTKSINSTSKKITKVINSTNKAKRSFDSAGRKINSMSKKMTKVINSTNKAKKSFDSAGKKINSMSKKMTKVINSTNKAKKTFDSAGRKINSMSKKMTKVINSTDKAKKSFDSTGKKIDLASASIDKLIKATNDAKKSFDNAGKSGSKGMDEAGKAADNTKGKFKSTESAALAFAQKAESGIKSFISTVAAPLTEVFDVNAMAKNYFADLETLDALSKKAGLSVGEQTEKQKLLSKYNKEDLGLYQDMKKSLDDLGSGLQEAFLPIMQVIVPALTWFSKKLLALTTFCKEHKAFVIPLIVGIAAVIATTLIPTIKAFGLTAKNSFTSAVRPLLPLIAAVAIFALIIEDLWVFMKGGDSATERLMKKFGSSKESIEGTRESVKKIFDLLQEFWPYIAGFFGFFMAKSAIFKLFAKTFGLVSKAFKFASMAIKGVALALRIMGAAAMANPLVLIIAAIIAAIVLCIIYWDDIKEACLSAWDSIKSAWGSAGEFFDNIIDGIKDSFQSFKDFIKDLLPPWLKDLLGIDGGKGISASLAGAKNALGNFLSSLLPQGIGNFLNNAGNAIKGIGSDVAGIVAPGLPAYAISPSSISHTKSSNTSVTTNMGGVNIEIKSTDPAQAGVEVKNGIQTMVTTNNVGVKQK